MTNKDKFIEVFGFEPDTETKLPICTPRGVECPFMDDGIYSECHCELWWGREYKAPDNRKCGACKHHVIMVEVGDGKPPRHTSGCELWECKFEPKEPTFKALGEELRKARKGIADKKVLIGYNMAVAICNKHLGESEADNGNDKRASN